MKKFSFLLLVLFLILVGSIFQKVTAQEKSKADLEKEQKIQMTIDQQKKTMAEQKKALDEVTQALREQLDNNLKDVGVEVGNEGKADAAPHVYLNFKGKGYVTPVSGDSERTTLEFSKSVKESTYSKGFSFDVEKSVKTVVMSVMGDCKAGEIRILIMKPAGKEYSNMVIDEFGNLNWRKSFTISEKENLDKVGEWKFVIYSTKATGFFKISLQTY